MGKYSPYSPKICTHGLKRNFPRHHRQMEWNWLSKWMEADESNLFLNRCRVHKHTHTHTHTHTHIMRTGVQTKQNKKRKSGEKKKSGEVTRRQAEWMRANKIKTTPQTLLLTSWLDVFLLLFSSFFLPLPLPLFFAPVVWGCGKWIWICEAA